MSETIEELTVNYEEDGLLKVKELDKIVLTKGAWSTIMFQFQNWDAAKDQYKAPAYAIRRYQKRNGAYMLKSKFNISSNDQAQKIIDALNKWISENPESESGE
jgi:hypothetical protein